MFIWNCVKLNFETANVSTFVTTSVNCYCTFSSALWLLRWCGDERITGDISGTQGSKPCVAQATTKFPLYFEKQKRKVI